jgi:hypothetical protein
MGSMGITDGENELCRANEVPGGWQWGQWRLLMARNELSRAGYNYMLLGHREHRR